MSIIEEAINEAAALRGQRKFAEAIGVVDEAIKQTPADHEAILVANIQGLHAAEEGDLPSEAKRFASAIRKTNPDFPAIKKYYS